MTEIIEKLAKVICDNVEYGFEFSDLTEGNFIRDKYINAAKAVMSYMAGAFTDERRIDNTNSQK